MIFRPRVSISSVKSIVAPRLAAAVLLVVEVELQRQETPQRASNARRRGRSASRTSISSSMSSTWRIVGWADCPDPSGRDPAPRRPGRPGHSPGTIRRAPSASGGWRRDVSFVEVHHLVILRSGSDSVMDDFGAGRPEPAGPRRSSGGHRSRRGSAGPRRRRRPWPSCSSGGTGAYSHATGTSPVTHLHRPVHDLLDAPGLGRVVGVLGQLDEDLVVDERDDAVAGPRSGPRGRAWRRRRPGPGTGVLRAWVKPTPAADPAGQRRHARAEEPAARSSSPPRGAARSGARSGSRFRAIRPSQTPSTIPGL